MERALEIFLEEYTIWLNATKKDYNETSKFFKETKKQVAAGQAHNDILKELDSKRRHLFQMLYMMMESHLRLHNVYSWYSDDDKKLIDEYKPVSQKAANLNGEIFDYIKSLQSTQNANL